MRGLLYRSPIVAVAIAVWAAAHVGARATAAPPRGSGDGASSGEFESIFRVSAGITDLAVDGAGNVYLAGDTRTTFPTTPDALDRVCNDDGRCGGASDAFLMILSPAGELQYATLVGGERSEQYTHIAVGPDGSVWIAGHTQSRTFGDQRDVAACNGSAVYLARLRPDRRSLDDFRCISGGGFSQPVDLAFDRGDDLWMLGWTTAADFPIARDAWQPTLAGLSDLFLMKFVTSQRDPVASTFIGGREQDTAIALALTESGDPVLTGYTSSTDFPLVRPAQSTFGGLVDAFVVRAAASLRYLEYSTYLGGSGQDVGYSVATDRDGASYVAGWTNSPDFPTSSDALDRNCGTGANCGLSDAFVASINSSGDLRFGSFLGGSEGDLGRGAAITPDGLFVSAGDTQSSDFPSVDPLPSPWTPMRLSSLPFLVVTDSLATRYQRATIAPVVSARPSTLETFTADRDFVYLAGRAGPFAESPFNGIYIRKLRTPR